MLVDLLSSPVLVALVGAAAGFGLALLREKLARVESRQDTLRQWRADAYAEFAKQAHSAVHRLGRKVIDGKADDLTDDDNWLYDAQVDSALRVVEIVGSDEVRAAAYAMKEAFREFRRTARAGVVYATDEYWGALAPFQEARQAFADAARRDLRGSDGP